jgi:hypothetical protein
LRYLDQIKALMEDIFDVVGGIGLIRPERPI